MMRNSRGQSSLAAVVAGGGLVFISSVVFVAAIGTSARATSDPGQGGGNSSAAHSNGHGNDDTKRVANDPSNRSPSGGNAGTSGDPTQPQPISNADANSVGANG